MVGTVHPTVGWAFVSRFLRVVSEEPHPTSFPPGGKGFSFSVSPTVGDRGSQWSAPWTPDSDGWNSLPIRYPKVPRQSVGWSAKLDFPVKLRIWPCCQDSSQCLIYRLGRCKNPGYIRV